MKFVVRLVVINFSILQNAFSELTKTLLCCTHIVDEPKIANRGGRRMQQQNEVTCTQMACVSVQIECLGCRFFDAVQTHQVDLKTRAKINVRVYRNVPHASERTPSQPATDAPVTSPHFGWLGKLLNEIGRKTNFVEA